MVILYEFVIVQDEEKMVLLRKAMQRQTDIMTQVPFIG